MARIPEQVLGRMSQESFTNLAKVARNQVHDVMSAGYQALEEKKTRGSQLWDITQMISVVRLQVHHSKFGAVSRDDQETLKPPHTSMLPQGSTAVYHQYIRDGIIDVKEHLLHLHQENKRLHGLVTYLTKKTQSATRETDPAAQQGEDLWDNQSALGHILEELNITDCEYDSQNEYSV